MNQTLKTIRLCGRMVLPAIVACLLLPAVAESQDAVFRLKSAGGSSKVNGKITKITSSGVIIDDREVKASEIRRLVFNKEPKEVSRAREQMESGRYADSLEELKKITDPVRNAKIQAEIEFIVAYSTSQISLRGGSIPAQTAGQTMGGFISKYPDSIHLYPAIEQYGKLIFAFGRPELAEAEFAKIATCDWLEYKLKGNFYRGEMLILLGKLPQAESAFDAILAVQENDDIAQQYKLLAKAGKAKTQGLQGNVAAAKQALEQLIKNENEDNKKLFAYLYNARGAVHEKAGKIKEASWDYLHTELLFASETEAHAEALYKLALLWPKREDTDRANRARDTLKNRYRNSYWASKL